MSGDWSRRLWLQRAAGWGALAALGAPSFTASAEPAGGPRRLVSLHGSLTEIVYLLQAQDQLVGTDTTSTHPSAARQGTKVGYMRQLSAEGVLALRPTQVLATEEAGPPVVLQQLRQAGVALTVLPIRHDFEDVLRKVQTVGEATGHVAGAHTLVAQLQAQWRDTRQRIAARQGQPAQVLFVMAHAGSPMTAGAGTAAHAMVELAGARNVLADIRGYRALTAEGIAQTRPDVILTTTDSIDASGGVERFWQHPGLAFTPAARGQRLIVLDTMALLGFGPRMPATVAELQRRLS